MEKTMECKNCGKTLYYNYHYHYYECGCGKCYNAVGNELAPVSNWRAEYDDEEGYY